MVIEFKNIKDYEEIEEEFLNMEGIGGSTVYSVRVESWVDEEI